MALIYDVAFNSQSRVLSLLDKAGNVISSCEVPTELTLTATVDNSSVKLTKKGTLSNTYEVNAGSGWVSYTFDTVINLNAGQSCKWRCSAHPTTQSDSSYVQFVMTGSIEASGEVYSMLSSNLSDVTTLNGYDHAFDSLFQDCTSLTKAPELPATTLEQFCYLCMFQGCTSLTKAPELPATTLLRSCYNAMFDGCTSLTKAPDLPATTLDIYCYIRMFQGCTSLTKAPELPATTLSSYCYSNMFSGCTSLTKAPELPATTLRDHCYLYMFSRCTSLTQAPELPATTLQEYCYYYMFNDCSALTEVRIKATTTASRALQSWLKNVAATGTVYADPSLTLPTNSVNGVPSGWTRKNIANYPTT